MVLALALAVRVQEALVEVVEAEAAVSAVDVLSD